MVGWTGSRSGRTPSAGAARPALLSPTSPSRWRCPGLAAGQGRGHAGHRAGLLGDGRAARLGDALALAGRPGRGGASRPSDLAVRGHVSQANYGNVFLLLIGGPIVGFLCDSLQQMAAERDRRRARRRRGRRAGPAGPRRARRRAAGARAGAAPRRRARRRRGRPRPAGGGAGGRAADADPAPGRGRRARWPARPAADLAAALARLEATRRVDGRGARRTGAAAGGRRRRAGRRGRRVPGQRAPPRRRRTPRPGCCSRRSRTGSSSRSRRGARHPRGPARAEAAREGRLGVGESIRGRIADLGGTADA